MKTEIELLKDANDLIRSFYQVTARSGKQTNWDALMKKTELILDEQHKFLNSLSTPPQKDRSIEFAMKEKGFVFNEKTGKIETIPEAIIFVRWANKNGWYKHNDPNDDCWTQPANVTTTGISVTLTTSELHAIFLKETNQ